MCMHTAWQPLVTVGNAAVNLWLDEIMNAIVPFSSELDFPRKTIPISALYTVLVRPLPHVAWEWPSALAALGMPLYCT